MANKLSTYKRRIIRALETAGTYSPGLDMQISALASALRTLDLANKDIDELEETTVLEKTRYGEKTAPHPVFKIQRDAQDSITRQLKILGLTVAALSGGIEDDPLIELTMKATAARGDSDQILKPK